MNAFSTNAGFSVIVGEETILWVESGKVNGDRSPILVTPDEGDPWRRDMVIGEDLNVEYTPFHTPEGEAYWKLAWSLEQFANLMIPVREYYIKAHTVT